LNQQRLEQARRYLGMISRRWDDALERCAGWFRGLSDWFIQFSLKLRF
jgi:hypothetical protein